MEIKVIVAALVAVMLVPVLAAAGGVMVIGNPSVPATTLSELDIIYIFLGDKTAWDDGKKITFVIQEDSAAHKTFLKEYISISPAQFANYWKKRVFTGKGSSPQSLKNDQEMIKFIGETKGAVGYVSSGTILNNVKTISVR